MASPTKNKDPRITGPISAVSSDNTPALSGTSQAPLILNPLLSTSATPAVSILQQLGGATGVEGISGSGVGVVGTSDSNDAINGLSHSPQHAGVSANNDAGGYGLWAKATIAGSFLGNVEVNGDALNDAFNSLSHSPAHAGVSANNDAGGFGLWAKATTAGYFDGNVQVVGDASVSGNLSVVGDIVLEGADCAEEFDLQAALDLDPGTVVVLDRNGALEASSQSYDRKVAGVISGAGEFRPGVVLDRRVTDRKRAPIALVGKVYCKVDAQYGAVEVGDLLTTSPTSGHAMRASDAARAFGAVIGKALRPLSSGQALVPILVTLQ